jgi:thymidine phosphorylase
MILNKRFDEEVKSNDILITMYSEEKEKLDNATNLISKLPVYQLK